MYCVFVYVCMYVCITLLILISQLSPFPYPKLFSLKPRRQRQTRIQPNPPESIRIQNESNKLKKKTQTLGI